MNILILLIGGNPLPNYVVARYLLMDGRDDEQELPKPDKIILICSKRTKRFESTIKERLEQNEKFSKNNVIKGYLGVEERIPGTIVETIIKELKKINNPENVSSIHLNYTGGTKSMSVHSYETIPIFSKEYFSKAKIILSDLNPENFKLVETKLNSKNLIAAVDKTVSKDDFFETITYPIGSIDLIDKVEISIEDILELHDMEIFNGGTTEFYFLEKCLTEFSKWRITSNESYDYCRKIEILLNDIKKARKNRNTTAVTESLQKLKDKLNELPIKNDIPDYEEIISKKAIEYFIIQSEPINELKRKLSGEVLKAIGNSICENIIYSEDELKSEPFALCLHNREIKIILNYAKRCGFAEYITGRWLEDLVLKSLKNLSNQNDIPKVNEIKKSVEAEYAEYKDRLTEIDLVVMKGYQMYLISCTTSQGIKDVKQKAFEAIYRAEQLGGEHAQVIIVSLMTSYNISTLYKDLKQFDASKNCCLIGFDEVTNEINGNGGDTLSSKLKERINKGG